jgi:hypothetical protein
VRPRRRGIDDVVDKRFDELETGDDRLTEDGRRRLPRQAADEERKKPTIEELPDPEGWVGIEW